MHKTENDDEGPITAELHTLVDTEVHISPTPSFIFSFSTSYGVPAQNTARNKSRTIMAQGGTARAAGTGEMKGGSKYFANQILPTSCTLFLREYPLSCPTMPLHNESVKSPFPQVGNSVLESSSLVFKLRLS